MNRKKKQRRKPVKESSAEMLGSGPEDEIFMGMTDMHDDGNDDATVPMGSGMDEQQLSCYDSEVDEFFRGPSKNKSKRVKKSLLKDKVMHTVCRGQEAEGVERLAANHGHHLSGACDEEQVTLSRGTRGKTIKKRFKNDVDDSKGDFEECWQQRGMKSHQSIDSFVEPLRNDEREEEQIEDDEAVTAFRAKLADLPLSKVREIKEKLGLKLFNKAYFGISNYDEMEKIRRAKLEEKSKEYVGQHRPKEITSKKPVSAFRPIYQITNNMKKRRDPRFDSRAGLYKEHCFEDNYSFLNDMKKREREELCKEAAEYEECGDMETAAKIRETIRRMDNREKTNADRKLKKITYQELRQENIERMMRGERPTFKTKAKVRMITMEKKFNQLKKEGKLDQYMKRKAKKEANREARKKPSFEEKYGYQ